MVTHDTRRYTGGSLTSSVDTGQAGAALVVAGADRSKLPAAITHAANTVATTTISGIRTCHPALAAGSTLTVNTELSDIMAAFTRTRAGMTEFMALHTGHAHLGFATRAVTALGVRGALVLDVLARGARFVAADHPAATAEFRAARGFPGTGSSQISARDAGQESGVAQGAVATLVMGRTGGGVDALGARLSGRL